MTYSLLNVDEPPPVAEFGRTAQSAFVINVDHASQRIPTRLRQLGLSSTELERHIAWDIGALLVAHEVATTLDARLIAQNYSRLVIDCNRNTSLPSSIPTMGESTEIPGNIGLSDVEVAARRSEIFQPYHDHLRALLDDRFRERRPSILVAIHSMTDVFMGVRRPMHAAILSTPDRRLADPLLNVLRSDSNLIVADNEPYSGSDERDYTMPYHGLARGLLHVEIEMRQDLICDDAGASVWAQRIAAALRRVEENGRC